MLSNHTVNLSHDFPVRNESTDMTNVEANSTAHNDQLANDSKDNTVSDDVSNATEHVNVDVV